MYDQISTAVTIHVFYGCEHQQLFKRGIFTNVALEIWIGVAPLLGGLDEECYIEQSCLGGIRDNCLCSSDCGGDEVGSYGIRVDAVIELGKCADQVPGLGETAFPWTSMITFSLCPILPPCGKLVLGNIVPTALLIVSQTPSNHRVFLVLSFANHPPRPFSGRRPWAYSKRIPALFDP